MDGRKDDLADVSTSGREKEVRSEEARFEEVSGNLRLAEGVNELVDNPGPVCDEANGELEYCSTEEELRTEGQVDQPTGNETSEGVKAGDVAEATSDWTGGVDEYSHPFWVLLEQAWYERW